MNGITKSSKREARLPRCVFKHDLVLYFNCSKAFLWQSILTEELFDSWGYDREQFKHAKLFGPKITRLIYVEFGITDLDEDFSEAIGRSIRDE